MSQPEVVVDAADVDVGKDKVVSLPVLSRRPGGSSCRPWRCSARSTGAWMEELFGLLHPAVKPDTGTPR